MSSILEFSNVVGAYRLGIPVVNGVSFSLSGGEVVGLLGPNGSGKTTLMRLAIGLLHPHEGAVRVFGMSPTQDPVAVKRRVGFVAEEQVLPPGASVGDLIDFHRYLFRTWDVQLEGEILERFSLARDDRILSLSKGQARAAALLCAVCHRPELLLLDEPAAGLDPAARREFLEVSIQLLNREGTTILFSSHYMNDVERIGGRVVVLDDGKVRLDSALDRLREDFCIALVPVQSVPDPQALTHIPGCLRARLAFGEWHIVFQGPPEAVERRLQKSLERNGIRCARVPLEDLFVELVGRPRVESP